MNSSGLILLPNQNNMFSFKTSLIDTAESNANSSGPSKPKPPKRALTAYNLFYKYKRSKILQASNTGNVTDKKGVRSVVCTTPGLENYSMSVRNSMPPDRLDELRRDVIRSALEHELLAKDNKNRRHQKSGKGVKMSFTEMNTLMVEAWKRADEYTKAIFKELAEDGKKEYHRQLEVYIYSREEFQLSKKKMQAIDAGLHNCTPSPTLNTSSAEMVSKPQDIIIKDHPVLSQLFEPVPFRPTATQASSACSNTILPTNTNNMSVVPASVPSIFNNMESTTSTGNSGNNGYSSNLWASTMNDISIEANMKPTEASCGGSGTFSPAAFSSQPARVAADIAATGHSTSFSSFNGYAPIGYSNNPLNTIQGTASVPYTQGVRTIPIQNQDASIPRRVSDIDEQPLKLTPPSISCITSLSSSPSKHQYQMTSWYSKACTQDLAQEEEDSASDDEFMDLINETLEADFSNVRDFGGKTKEKNIVSLLH